MCEIFEYVRGVVFVVVIFSINSCDNLYICIIYIFEFVVDNYLYIYYFELVSCIVYTTYCYKTTLEINKLPPEEDYNSYNRKLGQFQIFP